MRKVVFMMSVSLDGLASMKRVALGVAVGCIGIACSPAAPSAASATVHAPNGGITKDAPGAAPAASQSVLRITTDSAAERRVLVELHLEGALASAAASPLRFAPAHDAQIDNVSARDAKGDIAVTRAAEGAATRFALARPASGSLDVHYQVTFGAGDVGAAGKAIEVFAPYAEPIELAVAGEDILLLPESEERVALEIQLKTGGVASGAASSFALGSVQHVTVKVAELRNATFFAGDVGTAVFHRDDGDDFGAWIGFTAFDPRWVSAEIAGVRSAVDTYVGRMRGLDTPPTSILFAATRRDSLPIVVSSRVRGLVLSVDRRASWTPAVRILVAQALTRQYVGGFLWIGDRNDEASGAFFSDGFSRAIAREVLFDASWLAPSDRAAELNTLLSAIAFAGTDKNDARAVLMARAALAATALDVALRKAPANEHGAPSLKTFLRERLADAAKAKKDTLSFTDFVARVKESAGEAAAREMEAALHDGAEVKLPADLAGPCYRLVRKQLVAFELGFVTSSGEKLTVESVVAGSRAEAAGVRVGDVVSELRYEAGHSAVPVQLVLIRNEKKVPLHFKPEGASKPGRQFERLPGIPDDRC
jgi:hypothetical protein